jgi:hypothetical protein
MALDGALADGGRGVECGTDADRHLPVTQDVVPFRQETDEETPMPAAPQFRAEMRA